MRVIDLIEMLKVYPKHWEIMTMRCFEDESRRDVQDITILAHEEGTVYITHAEDSEEEEAYRRKFNN